MTRAGVFDRHWQELHRYVARRLGNQAAGDVAGEVFLQAFKSRGRYDPQHPDARPWLYGIASNLVSKHRRTEQRQPNLLARAAIDDVAEAFEERSDSRVEAVRIRPRLVSTLEQLRAADRDLLLLIAWAEPKAKAKARARLYAEFGRAPAAAPTRAPRTWWRPGVVWPVATTAGVAATCLVVGLVVVQAGPDGNDTGRPGVVTTKASGQAGVDVTTARTMELAARTVEKQPFTEPKPHDWLYWKLVHGEKKDTWEEWRRFDGKKGAFYENGQLMRVPEGSEKDSPQASYEFFASLPDDPAKAREQIYRASKRLQGQGWGDADSKAFQYVLELFENTTMMPPDARATLFRAIATIPGVRIERDVVDAAGRHGIGVSRSDGRDRRVLLLDDDYGYLGEQLIAERTYTDPPVPIPAFTTTMPAKVTKKGITSDVALVELTIVDGPGKRP